VIGTLESLVQDGGVAFLLLHASIHSVLELS
jgi:hypothetical protein